MFGFYEDEVTSCVSVFYIRGGAVVDKEDCLSGAERILDSETLSTFICEQYRMRTDIPATCCCPSRWRTQSARRCRHTFRRRQDIA